MEKKVFVIYAPSYDEHYGGAIVLHRLCHLLNELGQTALLLPCIDFPRLRKKDTKFKIILKKILNKPIGYIRFSRDFFLFKENKNWKTKKISLLKLFSYKFHQKSIVVYPDIVDGNPVFFKKVTRLLMHNPGHFTGKIKFGKGELIFRYSNSFARDLKVPEGSKISNHFINPTYLPECFKPYPIRERHGTAYCIRKGKGKKIIHDLTDSILVDDLSLEETAEVFRSVERFISYDSITALSGFALLCHCPSYIILGDDETPATYRPNEISQKMYAYDLNDTSVDWEKSFNIEEEFYKQTEANSICAVENFINDVKEFFKN